MPLPSDGNLHVHLPYDASMHRALARTTTGTGLGGCPPETGSRIT
jgi:hypothetical protein